MVLCDHMCDLSKMIFLYYMDMHHMICIEVSLCYTFVASWRFPIFVAVAFVARMMFFGLCGSFPIGMNFILTLFGICDKSLCGSFPIGMSFIVTFFGLCGGFLIEMSFILTFFGLCGRSLCGSFPIGMCFIIRIMSVSYHLCLM